MAASGFGDVLRQAGSAGSEDEEARGAAEQLVALTLVKPMLAMARDEPMRSELFHGGAAEQAFGAQLDDILAQRISTQASWPIVDAVYRSLRKGESGLSVQG